MTIPGVLGGVEGCLPTSTALNIVPDACTFEFEFRPLATDDVGSLVDEVMAYARERLEPEMRAVDPAARIVHLCLCVPKTSSV